MGNPVRFFILALTLSLTGAVQGAGLDAVERRLVSEIDRRQPDALDLLQRSVNVNSGTLNLAGVRQVGALFDEALAVLGFHTTWVDGEPFGRAGHLLARHGETGPHLLLIGHLDTVFEPDSPFQSYEPMAGREHVDGQSGVGSIGTATAPPAQRPADQPPADAQPGGGRARGPGIIDMKGGNVVIVEALAALQSAGVLDDLRVTVVMTGDEESSGRPLSAARRVLLTAAAAADVALGFEDGDGNPATAVIARRGYTGWRLVTAGTPAHSSLIFRDDVGAGAVYEAARILDTFRRELAGEQYLTFNPGLMLGGTRVDHDAANAGGEAAGKANVVAEHAVAEGDLRTLTAEQLESAKARMQDIVGRHLPGTSASIRFDDGYPPLAPTGGNRQLLALYDQASRDLGFGPVTAVDPSAAGAADISFTAGHVDMALDGLGLMGSGGHTVQETADLATLPSQTKRAAVLMYRLSQR